MKRHYVLIFPLLVIFSCTKDDSKKSPIDTNPMGIYEGDVALESQKEVDDFGAFGYTEITGNILIGRDANLEPTDITNLQPLGSLTKIGKSLRIINNENLTNLSGLDNVVEIGEELSIGSNDALLELNAFPNVKSIGLGNPFLSAIFIGSNPRLELIKGFNNLDQFVGDVVITKNESLKEFNSLNFSESIRSISILQNPMLTQLKGFEILQSSENISIGNNEALISIGGFNKLETVLEGLQISNNSSLRTISGFNMLTEVKFLTFQNHEKLEMIEGFENIKTIHSSFNLDYSEELKLISGFTNLEIVREQFRLNETLISNLDNFESLDLVESIFITGNPALVDFCGLNTAIKSGISGNYTVVDNLFNPTLEDLSDGNCSL